MSVFFISCKNKTNEKPVAASQNKRPVLEMDKTFPFSQADKIEVIAYENRHEWDTINDGESTYINDLIKNKKLMIGPDRINGRVILKDKERKRLFNFLFVKNCPKDGSIADCFEPRHSILFYNKQSEIIAYIEVCLGCANTESSEGFNYNDFCLERIGDLSDIFRDAGIKIQKEDEY